MRRILRWWLCLIAGGLLALQAGAQMVGASVAGEAGEAFQTPTAADEVSALQQNAEVRANWLTAGTVGLTAAYGASAWWSGDLSADFRTRSEGWFSQDTYGGGADKLGHAYSTYLGTRLLARGYEAAGLGSRAALERAALVSTTTLMGIEVIDGFSRQFRFSPEDALMNLAGIGFAWLLETRPELDRRLDFRLLYLRSADARREGSFDPVDDYSGQTYLLAVRGSGFDALTKRPVLPYLELLVGYGTRGYRPHFPGNERSRHVYVGIGVDLARLLDLAIFEPRHSGSRTQGLTRGALEYLQLPGTAFLHGDRQ